MIKNTHTLKPIEGKYVNLREVTVDDAAFILKLRTSEKAAKFLHKTENNLQKQIDYLNRYLTLDNEWYFIVERKDGVSLGTASVYDVKEDSVGIGRWLMSEKASFQESIESDCLLKTCAFQLSGFDKIHFNTHVFNKNIINFNKMWRAVVIKKDEDFVFFELSKDVFEKSKKNIERFYKGEII